MHTQWRTLLSSLAAAAVSIAVAACASTSGSAPSPAAAANMSLTPPSPDPRIGLKPGWFDAGEAAWNMALVSTTPPSESFINRADPGDQRVWNSDLAFTGNYAIQGSYSGWEIWDISNPRAPQLATAYYCPASQSDVSVYKNLLFISGEGLSGRLDCGGQGVQDTVSTERLRGLRIFDISDIRNPKTVAAYDYHPPTPEPTHTILPAAQPIAGKRIAVGVDEEHDHVRGQPHAHLWIFDVSDLKDIRPLSTFHVGENDSPWSTAPGRFGAHQFQEHIDDTLVFAAWFSGGLRVIDIKDPELPEEVGWFIPEPVGGNPSPQSNDVDVDAKGLVYLIDRNRGFDILEFTR